MTQKNYNLVTNQTFSEVWWNSPPSKGWLMTAITENTTKVYRPSGTGITQTGSGAGQPNDVAEFFANEPSKTDGTPCNFLVYGITYPTNAIANGDRVRVHCCAAASKLNNSGVSDITGMTQPTFGITTDAGAAISGGPANLPIPWTDYPWHGSNNARGQTAWPLTLTALAPTAASGGYMMVFNTTDGQRRIEIVPYSMFFAIANSSECLPPGPVGNIVGTQIDVAGSPTFQLTWEAPALVDTAHGGSVAGYNVYRDNVLVSTAQTGLTYTDTSPTVNAIHAYRVTPVEGKTPKPTALGSNPWEGCPTVWRVLIAPAVDLPPSPPPGFVAGGLSPTEAGMSWEAATDDVDVVGYNVYRCDTTYSGTYVKLNSTPLLRTEAGAIGSGAPLEWDPILHRYNYIDTGLTPERLYYYKASSIDTIGQESALSDWDEAETPALDLPPTAPTNLRATEITENSVRLQWDASFDDSGGIWQYIIFRDGLQIGYNEGGTGLSFRRWYDHPLNPDTTYVYTVVAEELDAPSYGGPPQQSPPSEPLTVTTGTAPDSVAPTTPTSLHVSSYGYTTITLAWNAATDDSAVIGYNVYEGATQIYTTAALTYQDRGLTQGTTHTYTVTAFDDAGNESEHSNTATGTTNLMSADTTPPSTPTDLHVTSHAYTTISLAWDAATDAVGVTGYRVYEGATQIATPSGLAYTVTGLAEGSTHTYTVTARDAAGNESAHSDSVTDTTDVSVPDTEPPTAPTDLHITDHSYTTISMEWEAATDDVGVIGYRVYEGATLRGTPSVTAFTATGLAQGSTHTYTVTARDAAGNESEHSDTATDTTLVSTDFTPPTVPTGLVVTGVTYNTVSLDWNASTDDDTGVAGYNIYVGATMVNTTPVAATAGDVGGLTPAHAYTFTVTSVDNSGNESEPSASVSTMTLDAPVTPSPEGEPWDVYATLADNLAPHVAAFAGKANFEPAVEKAIEYVPVVAEYVRGYTRGRGWTGAVPDGPLCAVIVAAAARLLTNPQQLRNYTVGDYTETPAILNGWTLPERAVLNRYRVRAA